MKILYLNGMYPTSKYKSKGIFVSQRVKALQSLNVDIDPTIICLCESPLWKWIKNYLFHMEPIDFPIEEQVGVHYQIVKIPYTIVDVVLYSFFPQLEFKRMYSKIKKRIDLKQYTGIHIHWFWPYLGGIAAEVWKKNKIPYYITCHGSEINYTFQTSKNKIYMKKILENAARVEFVSQRLLSMAKKVGYEDKNSIVINNGFNDEIFFMNRQINKKKYVVGYVGNLIAVKGGDRLTEIIPLLYQHFGEQVEFLIIGDGELKSYLENKLREYPVTFTGIIKPEEVAAKMNQMDILLMPSRNEGYPCVIKEAQACGVAIVGVDVGGICEAVGEFGRVVCDGEDEKELINRIVDQATEILETSPFNRDKMAGQAKKSSWKTLQKKWISIYK